MSSTVGIRLMSVVRQLLWGYVQLPKEVNNRNRDYSYLCQSGTPGFLVSNLQSGGSRHRSTIDFQKSDNKCSSFGRGD